MAMYSVASLPMLLPIGRQGENGVTQIQLDVSAWERAYPGILCAVTLQAPGDDAPFPVIGVTREGNVLTWLVQREATAAAGMGNMVVRGYLDQLEVRSARTRTLVEAGQGASGETPDAITSWIRETTALKAQIEAQAQAVAQAEAARSVYEPWNTGRNYHCGNKVTLDGRSYAWTLAAPSSAGLVPPAEGWLLIADRGEAYLASFHIDALGQLNVTYSEGYKGSVFSINENGELEAAI
jgi:hypothetical protein